MGSVNTIEKTKSGHRPLRIIAEEARKDMRTAMKSGICPPTALPYLMAMTELNDITDDYGYDDSVGIVLRFLGNASSWKGPTAAKIKKELRSICDDAQKARK